MTVQELSEAAVDLCGQTQLAQALRIGPGALAAQPPKHERPQAKDVTGRAAATAQALGRDEAGRSETLRAEAAKVSQRQPTLWTAQDVLRRDVGVMGTRSVERGERVGQLDTFGEHLL